jgi:hypothetical protein
MINPQGGTEIMVADWKTSILRITAFPPPDIKINAESWWAATVGQEPEKKVSEIRLGRYVYEGPLEPGKLMLRIQPARIDWIFSPNEVPESEVNETSTIGPYQETISIFHRTMNNWLNSDNHPAIMRIALGWILYMPVPSKEEGYRFLSSYVHEVNIDPVNTSDFLFQINKPRNSSSGVQGLKINRLTKWSVQRSIFTVFQFTPGSSPSQMVADTQFACRLELDINTSPDFSQPLPNDRLPSLLEEFINNGIEIIQKGDIQ